jgi:hypothetical protein
MMAAATVASMDATSAAELADAMDATLVAQ